MENEARKLLITLGKTAGVILDLDPPCRRLGAKLDSILPNEENTDLIAVLFVRDRGTCKYEYEATVGGSKLSHLIQQIRRLLPY